MPAQVVEGAKGVGTITAIDPVAGKVTFAHGPVQELHWPAMTMSFSAPLKLLDGFAIGDRVAFSFDWNGKSGRLVSIARQ
ncbi:MAG: copper-binding protein [Sphingomonas sp.]